MVVMRWRSRAKTSFQTSINSLGKREVGKNRPKLESLFWTSESEVGKFRWSWYFRTSARTFQLRRELSNFILSNFMSDFPSSNFFQLPFPTTRIPFSDLHPLRWEVYLEKMIWNWTFPTSLGKFQLNWQLSNFSLDFTFTFFQLNWFFNWFFQLNVSHFSK